MGRGQLHLLGLLHEPLRAQLLRRLLDEALPMLMRSTGITASQPAGSMAPVMISMQ